MAFDKKLIEKRFSTHLGKYNLLASVQRQICVNLSDKIKEFIPSQSVKKALEIGIGTGFLTSHLLDFFPESHWYLNDLTAKAEEFTNEYTQGKKTEYIWGDGEQIDYPENLDLIASASTVQWFDNLEEFISKASKTANYLALASFGKENFWQIKSLTSQTLKYYSPQELTLMLERHNYEVLYIDQYTDSLLFSSPLEVLHHIKSTGVNGITSKPWTRTTLQDFSVSYQSLCPDGITLSYQPIILIARKKQ